MLPTVAFIGTVAFGLTIFEISEETNVRRVDGKWQRVRGKVPTTSVASSWDPAGVQRREIPSGKFGVHAYAPYGVGWERYWREERPNTLKAQFDEIAVALEAGAPEIVKLVEEAEREAERRKREWEAEEREEKRRQQERRRAEALKNSREQLLSIVESWTRARQLEYFFAEMKTASKQLESEEAAVVERRLARARELFGGPEALNHFRAWKAPEER